MKFHLLMFSNISNIVDTISKFTVELKVYFCCLPKQQQQRNGRQCKHAMFLIKTFKLVNLWKVNSKLLN